MNPVTKCIILFLFLEVIAVVTVNGFDNFLCPRNPEDDAHNASSVFFPCTQDCTNQHGAVGGTCGDSSKGDNNCYCGALTGKRYEKSLQCMQPLEDRYRELCTIDCLCCHGATGGYCNWETKACVCMGSNPQNINCPAPTVQDYAHMVLEKSGKKDLGPYGLAFIGKIIPIPEVI